MAAVASAAFPAHAASTTTNNLSSRTSTTTLPSATGAPSQHTPPHSFSSASSPSSSSPTSPQQQVSAFAKRAPVKSSARPAQIGRPKNVGFVPAALRPTERPGAAHAKAHSIAGLRSGPPTPPRSLHNSTDNLADAGAAAGGANTCAAASRKSSSSTSSNSTSTLAHKLTPIEIPANSSLHDGPASARPATRGSAIISSPTASISSLSLSSIMSKQAQHPTKAHWRPDAMITECEFPYCSLNFGTFTRRHHCRRCGGIFCYKHAARTVPLDINACMVPTPLSSAPSSIPTTPKPQQGSGLVTPDEPEGSTEVGWWRVCEGCHDEWIGWVEGLHQRQQNGDANAFGERMHLPIDAPVPVQRKASLAGSLSGSVSTPWNWSTF